MSGGLTGASHGLAMSGGLTGASHGRAMSGGLSCESCAEIKLAHALPVALSARDCRRLAPV